MALAFKGTTNTARPSAVVVVCSLCTEPSGHLIVAVADAPPTPTGLLFASVCVNFPYTLTTPLAEYGVVALVAQPPQ